MILFRSTFQELIVPFFLTSGVMSFILLMQQFYRLVLLMVEKRFEILEAGLMLIYLLPQILAVTIPMGVVGAVFVTVIRQSVDSEIVCVRASGSSLWILAKPVMAFGLIATFVSLIIMNWVQPSSYRNYSDLQVRIIKNHADEKLVPGVFNFDFGNKAIQIGSRNADKELSKIFIADRDLSPTSPIILADTGRIEVDEDSKQVYFRLRNGAIYLPDKNPESFRTVNFGALNYLLEFEPEVSVTHNRLKRTGTLELMEQLKAMPEGTLSYARWMSEVHQRLALPWVCLGFALAAIPMAIVDPRSGRSGSFLRAIFLVITFYFVWIGFKDLVEGGKAPATVLGLPPLMIFLYGLLRLNQINSDTRPLLRFLKFPVR